MTDISNCVPIPGGVSCIRYVIKEYSYSIEKGTYPVWNIRPDNIGFESIALLQNWLQVNYGSDACITEIESGSGAVLGQICVIEMSNLGIYHVTAVDIGSGWISVSVETRGEGILNIYVNNILKESVGIYAADIGYGTQFYVGAGTHSIRAEGTGSSQTVSVTVVDGTPPPPPPGVSGKEYVFEFSGQLNQSSLFISAANKIVALLGGKSVYIEGNKLVVVM